MVGLMGWGATDKQGRRKGPWTPEEDKLLSAYIGLHGDGRWNSVARFAGLNRSGKSCRLRWVNYLRPGLKRGQITPQEESSIIELHSLLGNKWSTIACYLPGRTDNEIKNYWRTHFKKKAKPYQRLESRKTEAIRHEKHRQNDVKIIKNTEEGEVNNNIETQSNQEMMLVPPSMESQSFPTVTNNYQSEVSSWFDKMAEDGLWGSYWNADGPYDCLDQAEAQNDDSLWSF